MSRLLVIGATSAIARSVARLYAEQGARIFLVARDAVRLDAIADDLRVRGAVGVDSLAVDMTDHDRHPEIVEASHLAEELLRRHVGDLSLDVPILGGVRLASTRSQQGPRHRFIWNSMQGRPRRR